MLADLSVIGDIVVVRLLASMHDCIHRSTSLLSQAEERPCNLTGAGKVPSLIPA